MAITKLLRIKENKKGNKSAGLKRCLDYICNPEKTEDGRLITGNCGADPEFIYSEISYNKKSWGKETGSQGYHYVISFSPSEDVSAELALQVAQDFCGELLGGNHIYVCAAHTDQAHLHVHIVFDSVSFTDGSMYHSGQYDWLARIQPITDSICQKYGLSTLSYDPEKERKSMYHGEWEASKEKEKISKSVSWNDVIRDDIDSAISKSSDWEDFLHKLEALNYTVRDGKYLSLQPEGRDKAVRSVRLGPGYSREELLGRIGTAPKAIRTEGRSYKAYGDAAPVYRSAIGHIRNGKHYSPMQRDWLILFLRMRHYRNSANIPDWKMRKEVIKIGKISDQLTYMFEHDITSISDVRSYMTELDKVRGRDAARERKILRGISDIYAGSIAKDISKAISDDYTLPSEQDVYQIRINEALFANVNLSDETITIRIPGTDEYVRLYSDDSRSYNDGKTISSYLYSGADYQVEDRDGNIIRRITGDALKDRFKSKKIESNRKQQEEPPWTRRK